MNRSRKAGKRGITLIVLVITVIVMLIIAGVAISAITTNGVPFGKMQEAANKYNNEAQKEGEAINNIIAILDETGGDTEEGGSEVELPKAEEDMTIDGNDPTYANPLIPKGFKPINTETAVWGEEDAYKNGLVIQDATSDAQTVGSEFVWIPVPDYEKFKRYAGYYNGSLDELSFYNEADAAEGDTDLTGIKLEAQQMYASVKKYGGFYIARYEAGISRNMPQLSPSSNTTDTYADGTYKPTSIKDTYVWNYISWGGKGSLNTATDGYPGDDTANGAVKVARSMYADNEETTVTSTLCYGVQWDAVMAFIDPAYITGTCEATSFVRDSTGKGNYETASGGTETLQKTGYSDNYYVNNISDLGGNVGEWTMESMYPSERINRGGNFNSSGLYDSMSYRGNNGPGDFLDSLGFRCALYCSTEL